MGGRGDDRSASVASYSQEDRQEETRTQHAASFRYQRPPSPPDIAESALFATSCRSIKDKVKQNDETWDDEYLVQVVGISYVCC